MSSFESTALSTDTTSLPPGSAATPAASSEAGTPASAAAAAASGATSGDGATPLSAEETAEVFSEQPTGDVPTAEEMEDRKDATSSADNLLPTDKLQNGLKNVRESGESGRAPAGLPTSPASLFSPPLYNATAVSWGMGL